MLRGEMSLLSSNASCFRVARRKLNASSLLASIMDEPLAGRTMVWVLSGTAVVFLQDTVAVRVTSNKTTRRETIFMTAVYPLTKGGNRSLHGKGWIVAGRVVEWRAGLCGTICHRS